MIETQGLRVPVDSMRSASLGHLVCNLGQLYHSLRHTRDLGYPLHKQFTFYGIFYFLAFLDSSFSVLGAPRCQRRLEHKTNASASKHATFRAKAHAHLQSPCTQICEGIWQWPFTEPGVIDTATRTQIQNARYTSVYRNKKPLSARTILGFSKVVCKRFTIATVTPVNNHQHLLAHVCTCTADI